MTDLRKAAKMALEALEHFNQGNSPAVVQGEFDDEIESLRQALAQDALRKLAEIDHELGLYIDTVNTSQECVDETAKYRHEPVAGMFEEKLPDQNPPPWVKDYKPKREWSGLSVSKAEDLLGEFEDDRFEMLFALDKYLREKNGHV